MSYQHCNGQHDLIRIMTKPTGTPGIEHVTRWCRNCGAVVIDADVDGRTQPEASSSMWFPRIVAARDAGVGASGEETFRAEYTREELGKGVRGKYREIDWGEVDDELSDILIMCSGDQRVVLLPKLRELLRKVSGQ